MPDLSAKPTPVAPAATLARRQPPKAKRRQRAAYGSWADVPLVELPVYRPTCPACGALEHKLERSDANGDNTATRKATCEACGQRFKILASVQTLPTNGNWELPTD